MNDFVDIDNNELKNSVYKEITLRIIDICFEGKKI